MPKAFAGEANTFEESLFSGKGFAEERKPNKTV